MRSLVDQFSALAEFPTAQPRPADLNTIVENSLALFAGRLQNIRIVRNLAPGLPLVLADPEALKRALGNLIDNAAEAMQQSPPPRAPHLHRAARPSLVELTVADTGSGLTDDMRERLFLPYFSTKQRGTGLGLAIAAKIIQEHGGTIRAEKNEPAGARFIIELRPANPPATPIPTWNPLSPSPRKRRCSRASSAEPSASMTSMLVRLPIALLALSLPSCAWLSGGPPESPKLPTFAIPEHNRSDPEWPARTWPAEMRSAISQALNCSTCRRVSAFHIGLGALGPGAIITQQQDTCGQGNNCSTFVVLFRSKGKFESFTFGAPGSSGYFVVGADNPVPDLIATYDYPCCSANAQRFSFNGKTFRLSACDDLEFTESLWDMKHATIKPCH